MSGAFLARKLSRAAWLELTGGDEDLLEGVSDAELAERDLADGVLLINCSTGRKNGIRVTQNKRIGGAYLFAGDHGVSMQRVLQNAVGDSMSSRLGARLYTYSCGFPGRRTARSAPARVDRGNKRGSHRKAS